MIFVFPVECHIPLAISLNPHKLVFGITLPMQMGENEC